MTYSSRPSSFRTAPAGDRSLRSPVTPIEQGQLFTAKELAATYETRSSSPPNAPRQFDLDLPSLLDWKARVITFQKTEAIVPPIQQASLFDLAMVEPTKPAGKQSAVDINPFMLPRQNTQFWRWKASDAGVPAIYFVIDYACDLLLYVGETVKSEQRWKGEHGCKNYLLHYQQAHYTHNLPTQLGIAFWKEAAPKTRDRQKMESELILQWRSPFNKENWTFWGTPFVQAV